MDKAEELPDFLVIGAAKAGTTAFFRALARHPQIFCPPEKEPRYFSYAEARPHFACPGGAANAAKIVAHEADYRALFANRPPGNIAGESSNDYLASPIAPEVAFRYVPKARLIVILRHPVERAFSQWLHLRQEGQETILDFEAAWNAEEDRRAKGYRPSWQYQYRGFYGRHIDRWLEVFPREQLLVLFYEDWKEHPAETLNAAFSHLGVEPLRNPLVKRENVSSRQPRWPWLHHRMVENNALRRWAQRRLPLPVRDAITALVTGVNLKRGPVLDRDLRVKLARAFHEDLRRVEALTKRDLSAWRS